MTRQVATRAASAPVVGEPPKVPEQIRRMIADPFTLDGGEMPPWNLPAHLPDERAISLALSALAASMNGCSLEFMVEQLKSLVAVTNTRGVDQATWLLRYREYSNALCRYPADIVLTVIENAKRTEEWFPPLGKLDKLMGFELTARKRQIDRLNQMLKAAKEPPKGGPPKLCDMPMAERLRTMLATYRKVYGDRHPRSIGCEIELAKAEGRQPEAWAVEAVA
jgi:hypothetical protein